MFTSPALWKFVLMPGSLFGWAFAISGVLFPYEGLMRIIWLTVFLIWAVVHPLEIFISWDIGKSKNLSFVRTAIKTILFGFTWWLPLKMGVIDK